MAVEGWARRGVSVAWREGETYGRNTFRFAIPTPTTTISRRSIAGSPTSSRRRRASPPRTASMTSAGLAPKADSPCRHPSGSKKIGARRHTSTRTCSTISLDGLCKHYGLPGKDESVAARGDHRGRLRAKRKKTINVQNRIFGNCRRASSLRTPKPTRSRRWRFRETEPDSRH